MKYRALSVAFALLFASATLSVAAEPKLPKNLVGSFDKASKPSQRLQAKAPDWYHWQVVRVSPDGKYVARLTVTDGEYANVIVYRRVNQKNIWEERYAVSRNFDDVTDCIWVPKHAHRLVVSAGYENEAGVGVALWDGPNKMRVLKRLKVKFNFADNYGIYGISPDGRVLYCRHFGLGATNSENDFDVVQTLNLPK